MLRLVALNEEINPLVLVKIVKRRIVTKTERLRKLRHACDAVFDSVF